jgi:hypothetical protein
MELAWDSKAKSTESKKAVVRTDSKKVDGKYAAGQSPFEKLPTELLGELHTFV